MGEGDDGDTFNDDDDDDDDDDEEEEDAIEREEDCLRDAETVVACRLQVDFD